MRLLASILLALSFVASPVLAQDGEAERRVAAERYIKSEGQQRMLDQILSPEVMGAQLRAQFPQIPEDKMSTLVTIATEEIAKVRPQMEKAMIDAAVATFTAGEIRALDDFYRTPVGASVLTKMQPFMQRNFQAMAPTVQALQRNIAARASAVLKN